MLDAKIAYALNKIIQHSYYKNKVSLEEQNAQKEDRFLRGRQVAHMVSDNFRVTGAHDNVLDYAALFTFSLRNDEVQDSTRDKILLSMSKIPPDVLESFYKLRIRESNQPKYVLELYDLKNSSEDIEAQNKVKRSIDQKLRSRNFDARNERTETGAVVTNRRGQRGVERGPGECYQWKARGQCPKGDNCSFWHDENKRSKSTPKSALPSEPPTEKDGRSISRRRSLRGLSPSGKWPRQPCRDHIKGKWMRPLVIIGIFPNVYSTKKKNRDAISGISARLCTGRLNINPAKKRKRMVTEVQWLY